MIVSYFKTVINKEDVENPKYVEASSILKAIKKGEYKSAIDEIRSKSNKEDRDAVKKKLQAVLFAGKFKARRIDEFEDSSNLVNIDFDGIYGEDLNKLKDTLRNDKYIYAMFESPSGNGVKALVKCPFESHEEYKRSFCAIDDYFGQLKSFDLQCSDISRACFVSYDPDLYLNEDSEVFEGKKQDYAEYLSRRRSSSPDKVFTFLLKWMDSNGYSFAKGGRNHYLYVLASAMCRYGITDNETEGFFIKRFSEQDLSHSEIKQVISSAYKRNEFGIVKMTDIRPDDEKDFYKKIEVPDLDFDPSCSTVNPIETNNEILSIVGKPMDFVSFGLKAMDKYLVFKSREYYGIVAQSKAGKTQMIMYMSLMLAKNANLIFMVITTETSVASYKLMMSAFIMRKPFRNASQEELSEALEFIDNHYIFLTDDIDHLQILDVYHHATTEGVYVDCIIIDPISNVFDSKRINKTGKDYYQELNVRYLKFCKRYCSIWNIAHVVTYKEREGSIPNIADAEYGAEMARRVDVGLSFFRDSFNELRKYITECHVKFQRTEYIRGGGTTMSEKSIEFHFNASPTNFGYDVVVDGLKYKDPLHYNNERIVEHMSNPDTYLEPHKY